MRPDKANLLLAWQTAVSQAFQIVYLGLTAVDEDGEVLLGAYGYKVFFGGVYSVENYRAM